MQMAQDLDRQRREIQEALAELHEQERSLHRQIAQDVDDEEALQWELEPLPGPDEDDFLIPQRIRAWGEIMGALTEDPLAVLLTDNRLVVEHLLEKGMEHPQPEGPSRPLVLLQLAFPRFALMNLTEVARIRDEVGGILPWKVFCEKLEGFLGEVRLVPWSPEVAQEFQARGRALASYFQEAVMEPLLQRVTAMEPSWKHGWRQAMLEAILFPGITVVGLLKGEASPACPGAGRNAVVLHWDEGAPIDVTLASR